MLEDKVNGPLNPDEINTAETRLISLDPKCGNYTRIEIQQASECADNSECQMFEDKRGLLRVQVRLR